MRVKNDKAVAIGDGIPKGNICLDKYNKTIFPIGDFKPYKKGSMDSIYRIVQTKDACATLIGQKKNNGNRKHYHSDVSEWWLIIKGRFLFEIDGNQYIAKKMDVVFVPKGVVHKITSIDKYSIRLAVSKPNTKHIYVR